YRRTCKSSQPQRRGRPVTAPNSFPRSRTSLASRSGISVGNGPPPTLVVYAFEIPSTCLIFVGGTPTPVAAPPDVALEDVTYGYVPWSMSNMRSEEHTSELQSLAYLVCRLLLEKKKKTEQKSGLRS